MAEALESVRVRSYVRAAEVFGVSGRSVGTWRRAFKAGGRQAPPTAVARPRTGTGVLDASARGAVLHGIGHPKNWRVLARHHGRREHMTGTIRAVAGLLSHQQITALGLDPRM